MTKNPLGPVIATLALLLAVAAWYLARQQATIRTLQAAVLTARTTESTLRAQLSAASRSTARDSSDQASSRATLDSTSDPEPHPETAAETPEPKPLTPEQRQKILGDYAVVLAALKLSPEKLAALSQLLITRHLARQDAETAAEKQEITPRSPEWFRAIKQVEAPTDTALQSLLGPAGYEEFQSLMDRQASVHWVGIMKDIGCLGFLVEAGQPLTNDQVNSLALLQHQLSEQGVFNSSDQPDPATGLLPGHAAILSRAGSILSPGQTEALHRFYLQHARRPTQIEETTGSPP